MENKKSWSYPYPHVHDYAKLPDGPRLMKQIVDYLLDLPLPGYEPPDDNAYPRCRLVKYLYYDSAHPLEEALPTVEEKLSIVYNPERMDVPPTEKGYRIYPLVYPIQAQSMGQSVIKIYPGRALPDNVFQIDQAVIFEVLCSVAYESNARSDVMSRSYAIAAEILRSLNGVNMAGAGTWFYDRFQLSECGLYPITDEGANVGYRLTMGLSFMGGDDAKWEPDFLR